MTTSGIRRGKFLVAAAAMAFAAACKDSNTLAGPALMTPTASRTLTPAPAATVTVSMTPTADPTPMPTPTAATGLSGSWQGRISYHDPDWWSPCGDQRLFADATTATATFVQLGPSVTGTITSRCFSSARFEGTLEGGELRGTVSLSTGGFVQTGSSTGQGNESQIRLSTPWIDVTPSPCPGVAACRMGGFDLALSR